MQTSMAVKDLWTTIERVWAEMFPEQGPARIEAVTPGDHSRLALRVYGSVDRVSHLDVFVGRGGVPNFEIGGVNYRMQSSAGPKKAYSLAIAEFRQGRIVVPADVITVLSLKDGQLVPIYYRADQAIIIAGRAPIDSAHIEADRRMLALQNRLAASGPYVPLQDF